MRTERRFILFQGENSEGWGAVAVGDASRVKEVIGLILAVCVYQAALKEARFGELIFLAFGGHVDFRRLMGMSEEDDIGVS